MPSKFHNLYKLLFNRHNHGVPAPRIFSIYELKLLGSLIVLAGTLVWALVHNNAQEGVFGVAIIGGLSVYLSYKKYYLTYKPEMDRWKIRELADFNHPRVEVRVADRDLLISQSEVQQIADHYGVKIVHHPAPENPSVELYELEQGYRPSPYAKTVSGPQFLVLMLREALINYTSALAYSLLAQQGVLLKACWWPVEKVQRGRANKLQTPLGLASGALTLR